MTSIIFRLFVLHYLTYSLRPIHRCHWYCRSHTFEEPHIYPSTGCKCDDCFVINALRPQPRWTVQPCWTEVCRHILYVLYSLRHSPSLLHQSSYVVANIHSNIEANIEANPTVPQQKNKTDFLWFNLCLQHFKNRVR